ncbi:16141_t:CDS:2, partial [Racocetra persica]
FPNYFSDTLCITADNLTKLKYCEAIIKEACRMTPIIPVLKRVASAECEVAGFYLKNDIDEFNDDLNNFDFDKRSINDKDKYSLIIFGGGIRICPGRKLAMLNMLTFM